MRQAVEYLYGLASDRTLNSYSGPALMAKMFLEVGETQDLKISAHEDLYSDFALIGIPKKI